MNERASAILSLYYYLMTVVQAFDLLLHVLVVLVRNATGSGFHILYLSTQKKNLSPVRVGGVKLVKVWV